MPRGAMGKGDEEEDWSYKLLDAASVIRSDDDAGLARVGSHLATAQLRAHRGRAVEDCERVRSCCFGEEGIEVRQGRVRAGVMLGRPATLSAY